MHPHAGAAVRSAHLDSGPVMHLARPAVDLRIPRSLPHLCYQVHDEVGSGGPRQVLGQAPGGVPVAGIRAQPRDPRY